MDTTPPHDTQAEIDRLREELRITNDRFASWKVRAKEGVDILRQRVLDLTQQLESLEQQRSAPTTAVHAAASGSPPTGCSAPPCCSLEELDTALTLAELISDWCEQRAVLLLDSLQAPLPMGIPTHSELNPTSRREDEFEAYKRRTVLTLKLQSRNYEALQGQVEGLTQEKKQTAALLAERERVLAKQEGMILNLEQRLESAELCNRQMEARQDSILRGPNMEEVDAMQTDVESALEAMREEQVAMERAAFVRHHEELECLRAAHERQLNALRHEYEERTQLAVSVARAEQRDQMSSQMQNPQPAEDAVYLDLLQAYRTLETTHRRATDENAALRRQLQDGLPAAHKSEESSNGATAQGCASAARTPLSMSDATTIIEDLRQQVASLTAQLWKSKKALLDANFALPVTPGTGPTDQHATYLKSIVMKLLCARCDDVKVNLLPVLSVLLPLDSDDLRQVYEAHPKWIARER